MIARVLLAFAVAAVGFVATPASGQKGSPAAIEEIALAQLPREVHETLLLIRKRGPYPYAKDNAIFGNREAKLPKQKRGYYREYTVKTPGERTRGARRIVTGKDGELYYTPDHYNSFKRIRE